jgi:hypothetical protein
MLWREDPPLQMEEKKKKKPPLLSTTLTKLPFWMPVSVYGTGGKKGRCMPETLVKPCNDYASRRKTG